MHRPSLDSKHFEELASGSGIHSDLVTLNFRSLVDNACYEYLFISSRLPRTNSGQVSNWWLHRYANGVAGGWWCSGLDPLHNWSAMEWGCYKPNQPRQDNNGKLIKYEHPPCTATRLFCLRVSLDIWQKAASLYSVAMPENIEIATTGEALGFWQWVVTQRIPIILCEGAKKAASLLSHGYAAIALPGITSGYRVTKDLYGKVINRQLIPDLAVFTELQRTFYICFDYETQPKKIKAVNNAIAQLGQLLQAPSCNVKVIRLPGIEKGVDDFIVNQGIAAFQTVYTASADLELDLAKSKPDTELTYTPALTLNRRYLGDLDFPTSGLVAVKSAKGTGKTTTLLNIVAQASICDRPILLLTHRIQLGRFLCDKIGINWINGIKRDKREEEVGQWGSGGVGEKMPHSLLNSHQSTVTSHHSLGLCIDSIWKLNPENWQGAVVILDEVEQSLWHLLNSSTCKDKRIKILQVFQQLITTVLQTGGLVIAQDADLSDLSLDYLTSIVGFPVEPWLVVNNWKPEKGWDVTFYDTANPTALIQQIELDLIAGKKCYVTTDSRSGRYSPDTIESYLKQRLEQFKKKYPQTLVVSSQTTNTVGHDAANFVAAINQKSQDYDAVFVTPSLGTGVSIDVEHFDRVYGIFQGVIPDAEARQALARVRTNVPRIIWSAKRGIGIVGSGSTNYRVLSYWYQENHKENLALMNPLYKVDVDLPLVYDFIHLRTWAKFAAKINSSINLYRQSMLAGLIAEGHQVKVVGDANPSDRLKELRMALLRAVPNNWETCKNLVREIFLVQKQFSEQSKKSKLVKNQIKKIRKQREWQVANAVANALDIEYSRYEFLLSKRELAEGERHQLNKYILRQRYGVEVTPELKLRDDKGYYSQLIVHYYLTHESAYFRLRDKQEWHQHLDRGEGKVFLPDLKTYTLKIEALRALRIPMFLEPQRQFQENDLDLIDLKENALRCSKHIKRVIGINITNEQKREQISAIKILSQILGLLGLKLKRVKHIDPYFKTPIQLYQIAPVTLNDGREKIFETWHFWDALTKETTQLAQLTNLESEELGDRIQSGENCNFDSQQSITSVRAGLECI